MGTKKKKRRNKHIITLIAIILTFLFIAAIGLYLFLPFIVRISAPPVARLFGVANFAMHIDDLTWNNIDIRDIKTGTAKNSGIAVGRIRFIRSLSANQANKIIISKAIVEFDSTKGRFFIPGVNIPVSNPEIGAPAQITSLCKLPAAIKSLTNHSLEFKVENSYLILKNSEKSNVNTLKLAFDMNVNIDENGNFKFDFDAESNGFNKRNFLMPGMSCKKIIISFVAKGTVHENKICENIFAKLAISLSDLKFKHKKTSAVIPLMQISGNIKQDGYFLRGKTIAQFADAVFESADLKLSNISAKFPFDVMYSNRLSFPPQPSNEAGLLQIDRIAFGKTELGSAKLSYLQHGTKLTIKGIHEKLLAKEKALFNGKIQLPLAGKEFTASLNAILDCRKVKFDLGKYIPKMNGTVFEGNAKFESDIEYTKGNLTSFAKIAIRNSSIEDKNKGLVLKKMNLDFYIPDLSKVKSASAQKLAFELFEFGNLKFGKGNLQFQLESEKTFFLEKSEIEWCGGHIDFGAVRIDFDKPENVDFTFYCDRINVADLLNQLKVAKATGEGKLTGRMPIIFKDGHLEISNGILCSIPGEGGRIQLSDFSGTELANNSLQIALTKEALKDYNYKWIRLNFNTKPDSLLMKLELAGAPNRKLPFAPDKNTGMRYDEDARASFEAISFDINFTIPIDYFIYYGQKTSNLMQ